jgi:hypothetical protein
MEKTMGEAIECPFLTAEEAAIFLGLQKRTLDNMRWKGTGPRYRKHGTRVFYHPDDLKFYSSSRDCHSGPKVPEKTNSDFG